MSYARWSHSVWYIFWQAAGTTKETQRLACWHAAYALGDDSGCYDADYPTILGIADSGEWSKIPGYDDCTSDEIQVLTRAVETWLTEVEKEFPTTEVVTPAVTPFAFDTSKPVPGPFRMPTDNERRTWVMFEKPFKDCRSLCEMNPEIEEHCDASMRMIIEAPNMMSFLETILRDHEVYPRALVKEARSILGRIAGKS